MKQIRKRLTYANVMSSLAVFLVLGGATAFAATQLENGSVGTPQLKKEAVTLAKIKLAARNALKGQAGPAGPKGATGEKGATGAKGATGEKGADGLATGPAGGGLTGNYPNPTIAANAIGASQLQVNAVPNDGAGSDGSTKLATNSVNFNEIGSNAVHGFNFAGSGTFTLDPASIAANQCSFELPTVTGATNTATTTAIVEPPSSIVEADLSMTVGRSTSNGLVRLQFCNPTGVAINPGSGTYSYIVIAQ